MTAFRGFRPYSLLPLGILAYACATHLVYNYERSRAPLPGELQPVVRGLPSQATEVEHGAYQSIVETAGGYNLRYGFVNFNSDSLAVRMKVGQQGLDETKKEFGYAQAELDALLEAYRGRCRDALERARRLGRSQEEYDGEVAALERNYKKNRAQYLSSKGFKLVGEHKVEIDMPLLVRRNAPRLRKLAEVFQGIADEKSYDSGDRIGAVAAMAQTALFYREPPMADGERRICGLWPPLEALVLGWGDCDTKSGLAASILLNWPNIRAVGVALPDHYLMGVWRIPHRGDAYVEHGGLTYVLVEPAGPGWMPVGTVGRETLDALQTQGDVEIDEF